MHSENKPQSFIDFLREEFFQKKLLILGFGKEGQSSFRLLLKYLPEINCAVADGNEKLADLPILENVNSEALFFGKKYLEAVSQADVILKSPGVSLPDFVKIDNKQFTSQSDLFLRYYREQVVGVTGTKGKSTTVTLIHHILTRAGKTSVLLGNIGMPCFDKVDEIDDKSIVVFEFSAHQLEFVTVSPHISVLLNIFPEHLDYFKSFEAYQNAKMNIFRYQNIQDILIAHESLKQARTKINSRCLYFNSGKKNIDREIETPLLGKHNFQNIEAAVLVAEQFGISKSEAINSLVDFKPLPHRLEFVGKFKEIDFYNDSISTIPESAIAAVEALKCVDTLILGGFDRGLDYSGLVSFLNESAISNFIFLGRAGKKIKNQLEKLNKKGAKLIEVDCLKDAFPIIVENTKPGCICLLSPAASSYDQFHNFEHRGDTFKELAKNLSKQ